MNLQYVFLLLQLGVYVKHAYTSCNGDKLPWSTYGATKDSEDERLIEYEKQPDECCESSTLFIESAKEKIDGIPCKYHYVYHLEDIKDKEECMQACHDQNKGWIMRHPVHPIHPELCVGANYYPKGKSCLGDIEGRDCRSCVLLREYPEEMGGKEGCTLMFHRDVIALFVKPQCSFGKIKLYEQKLVTRAPRQNCNRNTLPKNFGEPNTTEGNIRMRLYEKLKSYCCSAETAFFANDAGLRLKYTGKDTPCNPDGSPSEFIEGSVWDEGQYSSDEMAKKACEEKCYTDYQKWIMGLSKRDKHCEAVVVNTAERTCKLFSATSFPGFPQQKFCPLVMDVSETNYEHDFTHEMKKQCILEDQTNDNFGHQFGECNSKESNSCVVEVKAKGVIFLYCDDSKQSISVDKVEWQGNISPCDMNNLRHLFNSRLRHGGYPREEEFHIEKMGVDICGAGWGRFNDRKLEVEYHCEGETLDFTSKQRYQNVVTKQTHFYIDVDKMEIAPIAIPEHYSIIGISDKCQNASTALIQKELYTALAGCEPYASDVVFFEWRCKIQCMVYFLNYYNYEKQFTHKHLCRGVVVKELDDGTWNCSLYDWPIHETPSELEGVPGSGCQIQKDAQDEQLYLLDNSCYEAFTPPPGNWEVPTILPWISPLDCHDSSQAFNQITQPRMEIICPEAYKWMPGQQQRNDLKTSAQLFTWDTGSVNKDVEQYMQYNTDSGVAHEYFCKRMCLEMHFFEHSKPCKAVSVIQRNDAPSGKNWFCIYKFMDNNDVNYCVAKKVAHGDNAQYIWFREFVLNEKCYEPTMKNNLYADSTEDSVEPIPKPPETRPAPGFGRSVGSCTNETNPIIHFGKVQKKDLECAQTHRETFENLNKAGALEKCALACLQMGRHYWFEGDPSADYSCKAFGATITELDFTTVNVTCQYFDWPANNRGCGEVNHEEQSLYYSKCYKEPEGLVRSLSDCSKFILPSDTGYEQLNVLDTDRTVQHGGWTTIKHNLLLDPLSSVIRIKCNFGEWENYECQESDVEEDCKEILAYNKEYGSPWHYMSYPYYAAIYKYFRQDATLDFASSICRGIEAELVSIHSQEENADIAINVVPKGEDYWIGLERKQSLNTFEWLDQSPVDFISQLGQCGNLQCERQEADRMCVYANNGAWNISDGDDGLKPCDVSVGGYVCQVIIREIGKHDTVDDSNEGVRKYEQWEDFCRLADRNNHKTALKTCKQRRNCEKYLKSHKNTKCQRVVKCRNIVDTDLESVMTTQVPNPLKNKKYSSDWCQQKMQEHGEIKTLQCIKRCRIILESAVMKYSKEYCNEKLGKFRKLKPKLTCISKCKQLNGGNSISKERKYSNEYCMKILNNYEKNKPRLLCVAKCKEQLANEGLTTEEKPPKYSRTYCRQKLEKYLIDKPDLSCVRKCRA